jgi:hypothetical protein
MNNLTYRWSYQNIAFRVVNVKECCLRLQEHQSTSLLCIFSVLIEFTVVVCCKYVELGSSS